MNQRLSVLRVLHHTVDPAVLCEGEEGGVEGGGVADQEDGHRLGLHLLHHQLRGGQPGLVAGDEDDHFIGAHLVQDFGQSTAYTGPETKDSQLSCQPDN